MYSGDSWREPAFPQTDRHPVTCVNWDDVQAYVSWLSRRTGSAYRLPTEAEWERAAAGSQPGCDRLGRGTRPDGTCAVGSYGTNAAGLSDMVGNLWEWTSDCWEGDCGRRVVARRLLGTAYAAVPPAWRALQVHPTANRNILPGFSRFEDAGLTLYSSALYILKGGLGGGAPQRPRRCHLRAGAGPTRAGRARRWSRCIVSCCGWYRRGEVPAESEVPAGGPAAGDGPRRARATGRGDVHTRPAAASGVGEPGDREVALPVPAGEGPRASGRAPLRVRGALSRRDRPARRRVAEGG